MSTLDLYNSMLVESNGDVIAAVTATLAHVIEREGQQSTEQASEFLTVKQAAAKYNLGERTVYRMIEEGLKVTRVGRAVRIKPRDLQRWLADSETKLR